MSAIAGKKSGLGWAVHISVAALVLLWLFPTVGLFVSSFRTADQISASGWWASLTSSEQIIQLRAGGGDAATRDGDLYVVEGNLLTDGEDAPGTDVTVNAYGVSSRAIGAYAVGETAEFGDGETFVLNADGTYRYTSVEEPGRRGQRVFVTAIAPPEFTFDNYRTILFSGTGQDNMAKAFFNTLTVTIPATIIPILIAAFAAYALAWMQFPGRALLDRGGRRPACRAAATRPDTASAPASGDWHRQGLSRGLAGAYGLRPAARDLSPAQLHGRSAARHYRERQG
jgi:alpha-glucoside transport system permease protein